MGRYRSSIALAGSGLLIAIFLIAKGPTLGDKGAGPLRAAAESLEYQAARAGRRRRGARDDARAAAAPVVGGRHRRRDGARPDHRRARLSRAARRGDRARADRQEVRTRGHAAARAAHGGALDAHDAPGAARHRRGRRAAGRLGRLPSSRASAPTPSPARWSWRAAWTSPRAADQLIRAGIAARIVTADGSATLTEVPALAREPETIIPIGTSSGMRLAGPAAGAQARRLDRARHLRSFDLGRRRGAGGAARRAARRRAAAGRARTASRPATSSPTPRRCWTCWSPSATSPPRRTAFT